MTAEEKLQAIVAEVKRRIAQYEKEEKKGWADARVRLNEYESMLDFIKLLPQFEVGDLIKKQYYPDGVYEVLSKEDSYYKLSDGHVCEFKSQGKWELVNKRLLNKYNQ